MPFLPLDLLEGRPGSGGQIVRLEFFFDKVVIALMFLSAALGVVGNFISEITASCAPPGNVTNIQGSYINSFCSQHLPATIYLAYFIVARGIIVLVPHYLWVLWYEGDVRAFFYAVSKLDVCRDPSTGRFPDKTVQQVKYLEKKKMFTHTRVYIYVAVYIITLLTQLLLLIASLYFSFALKLYDFTSCYERFTHTFNCQLTDHESILPPSVACYHGSLLISPYPSLFDLIIVLIALLATLGQIYYICFWPHPYHVKQGLNEAAEFCFDSSLPPEYYRYGKCRCLTFCYLLRCNSLALMSLVLLRSSHGHFRLLRDIQIAQKVQELRSECIFRLQGGGDGNQQDVLCEYCNLQVRRGCCPCQGFPYESHVGELGREIRRIINSLLTNDDPPNYQLPADLLIFAISFGPCTYYNFSCSNPPQIIAINFKSYVNQVKVNNLKDVRVISIQVPSGIYGSSTDEHTDFHNKISGVVNELQETAKKVYIIGPTKTSEKNRVLKVLGHIETLKPGLDRKVVCVCPSGIKGYEPFTALNNITLSDDRPVITATCGNREWKFNIKVNTN